MVTKTIATIASVKVITLSDSCRLTINPTSMFFLIVLSIIYNKTETFRVISPHGDGLVSVRYWVILTA
jgi:hypothetical protein